MHLKFEEIIRHIWKINVTRVGKYCNKYYLRTIHYICYYLFIGFVYHFWLFIIHYILYTNKIKLSLYLHWNFGWIIQIYKTAQIYCNWLYLYNITWLFKGDVCLCVKCIIKYVNFNIQIFGSIFCGNCLLIILLCICCFV